MKQEEHSDSVTLVAPTLLLALARCGRGQDEGAEAALYQEKANRCFAHCGPSRSQLVNERSLHFIRHVETPLAAQTRARANKAADLRVCNSVVHRLATGIMIGKTVAISPMVASVDLAPVSGCG